MDAAPWLERWTGLIARQSPAPAILELGGGSGRDTACLAQLGFTRITATDLSRQALAECACAVTAAQLVCHDLRNPLPFADNSFDIVLASLCLHCLQRRGHASPSRKWQSTDTSAPRWCGNLY